MVDFVLKIGITSWKIGTHSLFFFFLSFAFFFSLIKTLTLLIQHCLRPLHYNLLLILLLTIHMSQYLYYLQYIYYNYYTKKGPVLCMQSSKKYQQNYVYLQYWQQRLPFIFVNIKRVIAFGYMWLLYKTFMVLSEHEWIFLFELSVLQFFYGGNLTVINSFEAKFSKKAVSAYFLQVQLSVCHLWELVVVSGFVGHICNL